MHSLFSTRCLTVLLTSALLFMASTQAVSLGTAAETITRATVLPLAPAPESLASDPQRVRVIEDVTGFTVRSASGVPLRGGAAWVFRWGRKTGDTRYIHDPAYYSTLRDNGLNAVRLIWFDPWQWHHGPAPEYPDGYDHADLDSQEDVDATFAEIDQVINEASRNGMYVLLNYHNTGGYRDRKAKTISYLTRFWDIASQRYGHRSHVLFELVNEPVEWWPENYDDQLLHDLKVVYDLVRTQAPERHISILSFANTAGFASSTMRSVARRFSALGAIDWSNTSVAFHPYGNKGSSRDILDLMQEFPAINSEQGLPDNVSQGAEQMDGEYMGVQTMERLGISWFHWYIAGSDFEKHFIGRVLPDARAKGYLWSLDSEIPPAPTELTALGRDDGVLLTWSPVPYAAGYAVYRTDATGNDDRLIADWVHTLSYRDTDAVDGVSYQYRVAAVNAHGTGPASSPVTGASEQQAVGSGTGLTGQYYRDQALGDELKLTRVDPTVDFDWGWGPPVQGLEFKDFSLRWSGSLLAPYSGSYTIHLTADDGVRFALGEPDDTPLIDSWMQQDRRTHSCTVTLVGGQAYPLRLENFNHDGNHMVRLEWSYQGQQRQVIPSGFLYPATD